MVTAIQPLTTPSTAFGDAIRTLYGCGATWVYSVPVQVMLSRGRRWQGRVQVFRLHGHAFATWAYAWPHPTAQARDGGFVAILRQGEINCAEAAVRAAYRES